MVLGGVADLYEPVEHQDEACREQKRTKEAEVMAPLGRPECVNRQAEDHHECQQRRFDYDTACLVETRRKHISSQMWFLDQTGVPFGIPGSSGETRGQKM